MSLNPLDLKDIKYMTQGVIGKTERNTDQILALLEKNIAVSEKILDQMSKSRLSGPDQDVFQKTLL